ncbi:elongation factor RNA polymerase II S homeolog [Xenopus laevis]|uniref:Elongation factor RNA polymerase II S homeolog n=1 Tax=Xenopus laevis TaxID=8355 RepID=Q498F2_XENLA|nr:elongation factor RNA polymerase II S homeolog [Xenopus laevis]AAI00240.1 MGC115518 protein [Xenopus laevis]
MAALQEERSYGLSCGRVGGRVSVFHVKLTDSALKAFESYQNSRASLNLKPAIRFQGSQGQITIPQPECPTEVRTFTFYLSNVGRDSPQGSFDCIQQYIQSNGNVKLDCLGSIQDKITVCATDDSYQKARQSMAQAEEENKSRGAIVIKMGGRYGVKKVQVRKPAPGVPDAVPSRKHPTPVNLANAIKKTSTGLSQRPFKDRVVHLLALKPYKKPELILRLQKDGLSIQEKDLLDSLLQQVANLNAKDCTYTLKDCLYKEVQKDWPGYSEGDHQLLKRILARKLLQQQNPSTQPGDNAPLSPPKENVNSYSPLPQKRPPQNADFTDPLSKKLRISHFMHRSQPKSNGKLSSSNGKDSLAAAPSQIPSSDPVSSSSHLPAFPDPLSDSRTDAQHIDSVSHETTERLGHPLQTDSHDKNKLNCNSKHAKPKKKSKKHKEKERSKEKLEEKQNCTSVKNSGGTLQDSIDLNGACSNSSVPTSTSEMPDYLLKYAAISSQEQRQSYKNDFNAEYSVYRDLHARIERITRRFTQLDSQLKQLCQGSEDYKTIHDQILQEYRKIKKSNPNYSEEKNRCEYLHNKLAHIKKLIAQYDQQQFHSSH